MEEGENVLDLEAARNRLIQQDAEDKEVSVISVQLRLMSTCNVWL